MILSKIKKLSYRRILFTAILCATQSVELVAQTLDLSAKPLFLGREPDPNILFVLDDSGSMDFLNTVSESADDVHVDKAYVIDSWLEAGGRYEKMDFTPDTKTEALRLCPGYNVLAYDPRIKYTPWAGVDSNQRQYPDITDLEKAMKNPYLGDDDDNYIDISENIYIKWNDMSPKNGAYELGECDTLELPKEFSWNDYFPSKNGKNVNRCGSSANCTALTDNGLSDAEKTNYGNWFSYYRKRDFIAKKATLAVVEKSKNRLGLGTLHNNNDIGFPIEDMDDGNPNTVADGLHKLQLMSKIAQIRPNRGTPLRETLVKAGEYFAEGDGSLFESDDTESPILSLAKGGACQLNYTVLMSDGYANGDDPDDVGNEDEATKPFSGPLFADALSGTLADVAMKYYANDLNNLLPNKVQAAETDMHQHMITSTVGFGINGAMACNPGEELEGGDICDATWPTSISYDPDSEDSATIDDLRHAAFNGRGVFYDAKTPDALIKALASAGAGSTGAYTGAAIAANSGNLVVGTKIFKTEFYADDWSGNIKAYDISLGMNKAPCPGTRKGLVCADEKWDAASKINDLDVQHGGRSNRTSRQIITADSFNHPKNFTYADEVKGQVEAVVAANGVIDRSRFTRDSYDRAYPLVDFIENNNYDRSAAGDLWNFIRGERKDEFPNGLKFRNRGRSILGNMIQSAPVFVKEARFKYTWEGYDAYKELVAKPTSDNGREPMVYVGANDGMLHAFSADSGDEWFSYFPRVFYRNLPEMADKDAHFRYSADGTPTIGDVEIKSNDWTTMLTSGLKGGGQSVFALNIKDTAQFKESGHGDMVYWEWTDRNDPDMGYSYSRPDIVAVNATIGDSQTIGTRDSSDDPLRQWVVMFGNGYNSLEDDGEFIPSFDANAKQNGNEVKISRVSETGNAVLFIIAATTKNFTASILEPSDNVVKIDTGVGPEIEIDDDGVRTITGEGNGLSSVTPVDHNRDRVVDYAYAGDLYGNIWRFDLTDDDTDNWDATKIFTAVGPDGETQHITSRPSVSRHPSGKGFIVMVGTGKYLENGDNDSSSQTTQTFYGVWDKLDSVPTAFDRDGDKYLKQTITQEVNLGEGVGFARVSTDEPIDYTNSDDAHDGWYIDLVQPDTTKTHRGERNVTNSIVRGDRILFVTSTPNSDFCGGGGSGYLMELVIENGGQPDNSPLDIDGDGDIDDDDRVGVNQEVATGRSIDGLPSEATIIKDGDNEYIYIPTTDGDIVPIMGRSPTSGRQLGRKSWTELSLH